MKVDFEKLKDGLIPVIVQDTKTQKVLMHGFMNRKALKKTEKRGIVTFCLPSRNKLWTKGEKNGNHFKVEKMRLDSVGKSILISAVPGGKIYKKSSNTYFNEKNLPENFLLELEKYIERRKEKPRKTSPTTKLLNRGKSQISKKLGEEAVELVIESLKNDDELFKAEAADLLYHLMVMLSERGVKLNEVLEVLKKRRR